MSHIPKGSRYIVLLLLIFGSIAAPLASRAETENTCIVAGEMCAKAQLSSTTAVTGIPVAISAQVTNRTATARSNALVDIEIYDAQYQKVYQQFFSGQSFSPNQVKSYTVQWTPTKTGVYTVRMGLFADQWSALYGWTNSAGTFTVTTPPPPVTNPTVVNDTFADTFSSYMTGICLGDGKTMGTWTSVFAGYGCNTVTNLGTYKVLSAQPKASTSAGETHAGLITGPSFSGDKTYQFTVQTAKQIRTGTAPNTWETVWVVWNYTDNTHFYYLALKTNGWELGKEDPAYPGAQRFLKTGSSPTFPVGAWHDIAVTQVGNKITVSANDTVLTTVTDTERPYTSGKIGLYSEDALVYMKSVSVSPVSGTTASATTQSSTVQASSAQTVAPAVTTAVVTTPNTQVWWPTNNVQVTGVQPFKALVENKSLSEYQMYWQVDGGQLNFMSDSTVDSPHKESLVDVTNWNWKGTGPYTISFVAKSANGTLVATQSVVITIPQTTVSNNTSVSSPPSTPITSVVSQPPATTAAPVQVVQTNSSNPFAGSTFYVNPTNNAKRQADLWRSTRPADAALMDKMAAQPDAKWIGNWNTDLATDVRTYVDQATAQGAIPVLIAYNIPSRDCGSYSAGGAASAENYKTWIRTFANAIGSKKAAVILEPDALAGITCLDSAGQTSRLALLNDAIDVFKAKGNIAVYIDAGHSSWVNADDMSVRLKAAGIGKANGFALNVSNYQTTADQITYGTKLSGLVGNKHFVIDTSRNGQGPLGSEWCNPSGRGLGKSATTNTGNLLVDAFMWLKNPGESDGQCNGGPSAGTWWPEYALGMAQRAVL